jgi:hypothetical protein
LKSPCLRLQFASTVSFHIIFPSFTIGLAAWLTVLETFHLVTGKPVYRRVFEFWLKIFGVTFGMGVVSGIVLAFEFGMNWSRLSEVTGPIQGPLLTYVSFTAFALEASFFGVLIFGRNRVSPAVYLLSTLMVALGTTFSGFWIMVNNSWMQAPVGYAIKSGVFVPTDWKAIRLRCGAKRADGILNDPVRIGHATVLPEMLKPGCDHEGLEEASVLGRILEDVPSVCAIPPALLTQLPDGDEERVTFLGGDAVLDRYQYRTAIAIGVGRRDRRRPMHGGREVHSRI